MRRFRQFLAIDWSGAAGERQRGIALAMADANGGPPVLIKPPPRGWSRAEVLALLARMKQADLLVGMDLGIALPFADVGAYFPGWNESPADAPALWAMVDRLCSGEPHLAATRFADHPQAARHFRRAGGREGDLFHLPGAPHRRGRFRLAEWAQGARLGLRPYSNFNLVGAAQVGKSSLSGMRLLHRLRGSVPVWPIDPVPDEGALIIEIYTTIAALAGGRRPGQSKIGSFQALNEALGTIGSAPVPGEGVIDDHSADALISAAWMRKMAGEGGLWHPEGLSLAIARTEGWTFGVP